MANDTSDAAKRKRIYRAAGYWGDATLSDYWDMSLLSAPDKCAVADSHGARYTYKEIDAKAANICEYMRQSGVRRGDVVTVMVPGWAEFLMIYTACLKAGAVINPIHPRMQIDEIVYILTQCASKIIFLPSYFKNKNYTGYAEILHKRVPVNIVFVDKETVTGEGELFREIMKNSCTQPIREKCDADACAAILFTSGTESRPKGVMLTHNNIISAEKSFAAKIGFSSFDKIIMPAPVGHATGFHHGVTMPFIFSASSVLQDIFLPEKTLALIDEEQCTCGMGSTPFVYDILQTLRHKPRDISSMRFFLCGGAPIPRHIVEDAAGYGFKILGVYGSTESVPHVAASITDPIEKIINTDGSPVPGVEVRIVDSDGNDADMGEEWSRGPGVFVGYLNEPELTANVLTSDGWYKSGDICTIDADGFIRIIGRKKDMIIRGGENISSIEIENVLLSHPAVKEAAVVGVPDERLGEKACAFIVLNNDEKELCVEDLVDFFVSKGIAKFKCPEIMEYIERLPRTESGKVQKFVLLKLIQDKL